MIVLSNCHFVASETVGNGLQRSQVSLIEACARLHLNLESHIDGKENVAQTCKMLVNGQYQRKENENVSVVPPVVIPTQAFSVPLIQLL